MDRFLRIDVVRDRTGYSRGHIARLEAAGKFPPRRRIGARTAAWLESEIDEWMRSQPMAAEVRPDVGGDLPTRGHGLGHIAEGGAR
jgi:prophage regulatory protein